MIDDLRTRPPSELDLRIHVQIMQPLARRLELVLVLSHSLVRYDRNSMNDFSTTLNFIEFSVIH